jgi:type IV secretion system protein VirB5
MLAKQAWQSREDDFKSRLRRSNRITAGSLALAFMVTGGYIALSLQHKVVPYVVEVNGNAEVVRVTRADEAGPVKENQIRAQLNTWITGARAVYSDPYALQKDVDSTYATTASRSPAYTALLAYQTANNPFERSRKENVTVTVNLINPVAPNSDTWRIRWTEIIREASGKSDRTEVWEGSFTIVIAAPAKPEQILVNPYGVYVKDFAWTKMIELQKDAHK